MGSLTLEEQRAVLLVARSVCQRLGAERFAAAIGVSPSRVAALLDGDVPLTSELVARITAAFGALPARNVKSNVR